MRLMLYNCSSLPSLDKSPEMITNEEPVVVDLVDSGYQLLFVFIAWSDMNVGKQSEVESKGIAAVENK